MNNSKGYHVITLIIIPLLVAALWEKLLGPLFDIIIKWLSEFGSQFIQVILDAIYSRIALGRYIDISFYIFVLIVSYWLSSLVGITHSEIKNYKEALNLQKVSEPNNCDTEVDLLKEESQESKKESLDSRVNNLVKSTKRSSKMLISLTIVAYFLYVVFIISTTYINSTITRITNNIEIVAPYIDDSEYKNLKSLFYSVKCSDDYRSLSDRLNHIAEEHNIRLQD